MAKANDTEGREELIYKLIGKASELHAAEDEWSKQLDRVAALLEVTTKWAIEGEDPTILPGCLDGIKFLAEEMLEHQFKVRKEIDGIFSILRGEQ